MSDHQVKAPNGQDLDAVTSVVLTASRLLVAIAARSLAAVEDKVTLPQFRMLVVAGYADTKLVSLAERLGVNPSTAMRMAERLATQGLISREVNPHNRRESLLRLTSQGRRIVDEVTARRHDEISRILSRMSSEQRQALITAMTVFNDAGGEPTTGNLHPLGWPETPAPSL